MPHYPGCGVGGHCIPVDPYYLIKKAKEVGFDHKFLRLAREINNRMPLYVVNKLVNELKKLGLKIKGIKIGLLGLSYKANIGDMRESPALEIKKELERLGANVMSCDPYCNGHADARVEEILEKCVGVIIATDHKEFLDIKSWNKVKIIVDGKNCLDKERIKQKNVQVIGIGAGVD